MDAEVGSGEVMMLSFYRDRIGNKTFLDRFPHHIFNPECLHYANVLEVGMGFGYDARWIVDRLGGIGMYVGVDLELECDVVSDGCALAAKSNSMDIVLMINVLHCQPDMIYVDHILSEAHRVLRVGGVVVGRTMSSELYEDNVAGCGGFVLDTYQALVAGKLLGIRPEILVTYGGKLGFAEVRTWPKSDDMQRKPYHSYFFRMRKGWQEGG